MYWILKNKTSVYISKYSYLIFFPSGPLSVFKSLSPVLKKGKKK